MPFISVVTILFGQTLHHIKSHDTSHDIKSHDNTGRSTLDTSRFSNGTKPLLWVETE